MVIKHEYKTTFLEKEDDNFYYLLGYFMTDGCIIYNIDKKRYRAQLCSNDKDHLEHINPYFSDLSLISKNRNNYVLNVCNKIIAKKLVDKGCVPNKTLILKFPDVPEQYLPDFIRGCVDGDGSLSFTKNGKNDKYPIFSFYSAAKDFIYGIKSTLDNWQIKNTIRVQETDMSKIHIVSVLGNVIQKHDQYIIQIRRTEEIQKFLKIIYYDNCYFAMPRKLKITKEILQLTIRRMGEHHCCAKLKEKDILNIREQCKNGVSKKKIAKQFNINWRTVYHIFNNECWKHI